MILTRREFALLSIAALLIRRAGGLNVRIGLRGPAQSRAGRGAYMSALEAQRAATLLGNTIMLVDATAASAPLSGLVMLGGETTPTPANIPILSIVPADQRHGDNVFYLQPASAPNCVVWSGALEKYGAAQLNDRYRSKFDEDMDAEAWAGWFAVKVLWESALRARSDKAEDILAFLKSNRATFDGHKGDLLRFDATGHLVTWQDSNSPSAYPCSR